MSLASVNNLFLRASLLSETRTFFQQRNVLEVDCPALEPFAPIDAHIDPIRASGGYLHTSPEYGMKKLLAQGIGDIYQLSHVFRHEERGRIHSIEFTMLEWYRLKLTFEELIEETCALIHLFVPNLQFEILSYREAFERHVCSLEAPRDELLSHLSNLSEEVAAAERSVLIDLCFSQHVEKNLPEGSIITEFPPESAALAKTTHDESGRLVAKRFEVYVRGVEIANGYDELQNSSELRTRFERANIQRKEMGKESFAIDTELLKAIETMPPCVGVAVGFDRLVMLAADAHSISEIQP